MKILLQIESVYEKARNAEEARQKVQGKIDRDCPGWSRVEEVVLYKNLPGGEKVWEVKVAPVVIDNVPEKCFSRALREACKKYGLTKRDLWVRP
ncbi:MAG: hypothetical protein BWY03_00097 [Parcubacteria group bacterium ADurb.Bin159]|jgi:hypothetical protein|nr:MAG: hypothetical protein BWY03_00097 [Parcubacteria group bacterium ADurb.Bin159]